MRPGRPLKIGSTSVGSARSRAFAACLLLSLLSGAAHATSKEAEIRIPARQYTDAAHAALLARLRQSDGRFELELRGRYRDLTVSGLGGISLQARIINPRAMPESVVWMDVSMHSRVVRHVPVRFRVHWFKPVLVAKHRIEARTPLLPEMFDVQEADVAVFSGDAADSMARLANTRARRNLNANAVLALNAIEPRPAVEVGQRIDVTTQVGRVIVRRSAIAEHDGHTGQRISARLPDSDERLSVRVTGHNAARVSDDG